VFDQRNAIELALRKQRLQIQSASLRERMAMHAEGIAPALSVIDSARSGWHWMLKHPLLPLCAAAVLVLFRPRRTLRLLQRGVLIWQLLRRLRSWAGSRRAAAPP
jgi:hypothetical protein